MLFYFMLVFLKKYFLCILLLKLSTQTYTTSPLMMTKSMVESV